MSKDNHYVCNTESGCKVGAIHFQLRQNLPSRKAIDDCSVVSATYDMHARIMVV